MFSVASLWKFTFFFQQIVKFQLKIFNEQGIPADEVLVVTQVSTFQNDEEIENLYLLHVTKHEIIMIKPTFHFKIGLNTIYFS